MTSKPINLFIKCEMCNGPKAVHKKFQTKLGLRGWQSVALGQTKPIIFNGAKMGHDENAFNEGRPTTDMKAKWPTR